MAYPVYKEAIIVDGTPASVAVPLPYSYMQTGDMVIICLTQDNATGISTPSGWTALNTFSANSGVGLRAYRRIVDGTETDPTFTGVADDWLYQVQVWRDVDTTTPIEATSRTNWTGDTATTSALNTSTNGVVLLQFITGDADTYYRIDDNLYPLGGDCNGAVSLFSAYRVQAAAASPVPTSTWYTNQSDEGGNLLMLAIRNKSGGALPEDPGRGVMIADQMNNVGTITALSSKLTTLDGIGVAATVTTAIQVNVSDPYRGSWFIRMGTADNSTIWSGGIRQLPASTDMTDSIVSWPWRYSSMSHVGPDGNCVVFFDSAGNWAAFRVSKKSGISSSPSMYVNHVDTNATPFDSSGSIDWSDITHMGFAYRRNTTATLMYYEVGAIAYTKKAGGGAITGGSAESPVTLKTFAEPALGFLRNMEGRVGFQGSGQVVLRHDIIIGDGSTPTYLDLNGASVESPPPYNYDTADRFWNVESGRASIRINACPTCTMRARNWSFVPLVRSQIVIEAGSDPDADYEFAGSLYSNIDFIDLAGVPVDGAKFDGAWPVQTVAGTSFNGCTFNNPADTSSVLMTAGNVFTNCRFNSDDAAKFAGTISAAGDYYFHGCTWEGSTDDLNVTAASGTVTLHFDLGDQVPDFVTAGADVDIDQPVVSATGSVAGMPAGGRLWVYNEDTATEMVNAVQAGSTYSTSYPDGTGYSAGDTIKMRWRKPNYEDREYTTVATSGGWSFTVETELDPHYSGTTPANVTVDYTNKKIRATSTRDNFTAQEVADIVKNAEATVDGIRLAAFAEISGMVELSPGVSNALTIKLVDWQLSWAAGSVAQAFVTGGNVVGGLAGDLIEDVVGGPQVTVLQAQSGTVVSVGSGVLPSDITAIAEAVRAELATEMARIDVAVSTRLAAAGYTAPDNASVTAIKAKTDNLPADPASTTQVNTRLAAAAYTAPDNAGITAINTKVTEFHKIQGLDASAPMTVTPSSRVAGDITLAITGDGETTSTVTRT